MQHFVMTRILPVFLLITGFGSMPGYAQQRDLDSLLSLLKNHPQHDTTRLNLLNDIAFGYNAIDPDKGLETADQAIALALQLDHQRKLASAYSHKGVNYMAKGEDTLALRMYARALDIHTKTGNKTGMANLYNNMAIVHVGVSDYAKALDYHGMARAIYYETGDKRRLANALNNTGVVYLYMSDYPRALEYYLQSLRLLEELNNEIATANALTNIGIIHKNMGDYGKALEYHQNALRLYERLGNKQGLANAYGNIGVVYDGLSNSTGALEVYQKALALNESLGNKKRIASDLTNIGIIYNGLGDYQTALDYFKKALPLYEESGDRNSMSILLNQMGDIYADVPAGDPQFTKAMESLDRSLKIAQETGAPDRQSESWGSLARLHEKQGNYQEALHAYQQHIIFRDSIYNAENEREITRREMQFEFEKKEVLAAAELNRHRMIKNATLGSAVALLLAGIIIFVLYKKRRDAQDQQKEAEFRAEVADTEMKALRLQMNPHFIFNSLNSISDYIGRNDAQEADRYLTKFARVMRMILENSEQKEVSLADDLQALELYIQLESLRLQHKLTYEINVDDGIDPENTMIPPLVLQPFVENSIWHGIAHKQGSGHIVIHIHRNGNMLQCTVEDDGIGREQAAKSSGRRPGKSLGLKITNARIDIINKTRRSTATVKLEDLDEGTRATVKLPFEMSI